MTLHLVTTIPQADGETRYLLMRNARIAREWAAEIRSDTAMIDGAAADYAIDVDSGGCPTATIYPGQSVSPDEWRAIHAAIATHDGEDYDGEDFDD
jgi:hypothetical protein